MDSFVLKPLQDQLGLQLVQQLKKLGSSKEKRRGEKQINKIIFLMNIKFILEPPVFMLDFKGRNNSAIPLKQQETSQLHPSINVHF